MNQDSLDTIAQWCQDAASNGASDVFLSEGLPPRTRIHGRVQPMTDSAVVARRDLESLWQTCAQGAADRHDVDAHWESGDLRFRVHLYRHLNQLGAVLRIIHRSIPSLESLHLPVEILQQWCRRPHGLILITGPTGCGKSTTVAALLEWMNGWLDGHVVTIEEPIEFLFTSRRCLFTQRELPDDVPDFTSGLRAAVRQSPDVIFLGEIRDFESARIAIQAAETGHLVISTLHTATVVETMERLTNLMPANERDGVLSLLATQLIGVMTQQLLPQKTGGRRVITEFFQNEAATRDWIHAMDYHSLTDFVEAGRTANERSFMHSLTEAISADWLSMQAAMEAASNPKQLQRAIRGIS